MSEKGAKHRTLQSSPKESGTDDAQSKFNSIVEMFNKSAEDVSSSVPSSAGRTTPSIPTTFQASIVSLPTEEQVMEQSGIPAQQKVLLPTDPRSAKLASDIRSKIGKQSQVSSTTKAWGKDSGINTKFSRKLGLRSEIHSND